MFQPGAAGSGLHLPPVQWRPVLRANRLLERMGEKLWSGFSGVHLIEVQKQIYAATPVAGRTRKRQRRRVPAMAAPARTSHDRDTLSGS